MARVFVDTNVLFPYSVMELMLALTEDAIHEIVWSDALLDEWERVIVRQQRRSAASAAAITSAIREYFGEGRVARAEYAHLVDDMPSKDPDDRQHIAAALAGNAQVVVTWNRADFPAGPLAELGLRVLNPDIYLQELFAELPEEVTATAVRVADDRGRAALDLTDTLTKAGVPVFAGLLRARLAPPDPRPGPPDPESGLPDPQPGLPDPATGVSVRADLPEAHRP